MQFSNGACVRVESSLPTLQVVCDRELLRNENEIKRNLSKSTTPRRMSKGTIRKLRWKTHKDELYMLKCYQIYRSPASVSVFYGTRFNAFWELN